MGEEKVVILSDQKVQYIFAGATNFDKSCDHKCNILLKKSNTEVYYVEIYCLKPFV